MEAVLTLRAIIESMQITILNCIKGNTLIGGDIEIVVVHALFTEIISEVSSTVFYDYSYWFAFVSFQVIVLETVLTGPHDGILSTIGDLGGGLDTFGLFGVQNIACFALST